MATTVYTTPPLHSTELTKRAMDDLHLIAEALREGTGDFTGIGFISAVIGDDRVMTVTLDNPIPDNQLVQFNFV